MGKKAWSDPREIRHRAREDSLGRFNEPIDVANAMVLFLKRPAAMVNGAILAVDGGFLVRG